MQRKQAALAATQGLMVLGDEDEITMDDALKAFDKAGPGPTILSNNECALYIYNVFVCSCLFIK